MNANIQNSNSLIVQLYNKKYLRLTFIVSPSQEEEEEGMTICAGSPTSTKSLSPRRLQKMRRVWHTHACMYAHTQIHISKLVNYSYTYHTRAQFSLDRHGCSVPLLYFFCPLFLLIPLFFPLSPHHSLFSFISIPLLSLSPSPPTLSLSLVTALGSTLVCQGAKCNDKHFFFFQRTHVEHSVFFSEQHGQ